MSVNYSLGAGKPLISREQNYVLDRKLLTVHSEDRDFSKWSNANEFEIVLPEQLLNVQSMRLVEIETPNNFNVFSTSNQNTKMFINYNSTGSKELTITPGTYTPATLVAEINTQLIASIDGTHDLQFQFTNNLFSFKSTTNNYILDFSRNSNYSIPCPTFNNDIFLNTFNWGLPYNLGFSKKSYSSATLGKTITAENIASLAPDTCMYMEIEKYNSYDELYPCIQSNFDHNSTSKIRLVNANNSSSGKINSAFAKIPLVTCNTASVVFESRNIGLQNITHYDPPIERIPRLKFKFRFHDGRLVDFGNNQFNFTIEFNMLRNEMGKQLNVRIPSTYAL